MQYSWTGKLQTCRLSGSGTTTVSIDGGAARETGSCWDCAGPPSWPAWAGCWAGAARLGLLSSAAASGFSEAGMRFLGTFGTGLLSRSEKVGLAGGALLLAAPVHW